MNFGTLSNEVKNTYKIFLVNSLLAFRLACAVCFYGRVATDGPFSFPSSASTFRLSHLWIHFSQVTSPGIAGTNLKLVERYICHRVPGEPWSGQMKLWEAEGSRSPSGARWQRSPVVRGTSGRKTDPEPRISGDLTRQKSSPRHFPNKNPNRDGNT